MSLKLSQHPSLKELRERYLPYSPKIYLSRLEYYHSRMDELRERYIKATWHIRIHARRLQERYDSIVSPTCATEGCNNTPRTMTFSTCYECHRKWRACTKKRRYPFFIAAEWAKYVMVLAGYMPWTTISYECPHCIGWHLSSKKREPRPTKQESMPETATCDIKVIPQ